MIESLKDYELILDSDDLVTRRRAATETATPEVWQEILTRRPDLEEEVVFNKHLPETILELLVNSNSPRVRSAVAMKRALNEQQFQRLATDTDDSVRIMVSNNKKTPQVVLEKLVYDSCESVSIAARRQLRDRGNTS